MFRLPIVDFLEDGLSEAAGGSFEDYAASFDSFPDLPDDFVPGRISEPSFFSFWRDVLKADPEVLSIVKDGYRIPFVGGVDPPPSAEPNNRSALDKPDFLLESLLSWERSGCTTKVTSKPRIVLLISVVYSNKWREVVYASRSVNPYVIKNKVFLEPLADIGEVVSPGDWFSKQDLSQGYHHVMIHPDCRQNFGVHYVHDDGSISYWVWNVLFLCKRNGVHLFTKVLKPHRRFLAERGIKHRLWIDDFLIVSKSFLKCLSDTQVHLEALYLAGWIVRPKKCSNFPVQRMQFLGLIVDSTSLAFYIPDSKKSRIIEKIDRVLGADWMPVRTLAALYGLLISVALAVGPAIRLLTRFCFGIIRKRLPGINSSLSLGSASGSSPTLSPT